MFRIIFLLILLAACEKNETIEKEDLSIPVQAVFPTVSDIPLHLEFIGSLHPSVLIELIPQIGGTLEEIFVQEGSFVKAGSPLFQIDRNPLILKKKEVEAQIAIDTASLLAIERKLARFERLGNKGLIAEAEWDKYKTEFEKTAGLLELDQARLEKAALDLARCTLISPIDGKVGTIEASKGQTISSKQAITTILQLDPLFVEMGLTEKELDQLMPGKTPLVVERQGKKFFGEITFIDHHFDPKTGLILVRGSIPNSEMSLRPGQLVEAKIPLELKRNALTIPYKAVKRKGSETYVYLISPEETAILQPIRIGEEIGKEVIVLEGLDKNDRVIVEGLIRLFPGVKVRP